MAQNKTQEGGSLFKETEQVAGHIVLESGTLLLTDGVWDAPGVKAANKLKLDLQEDGRISVPVTTILQNGKRYILLCIDSGTRLGVEDGLVDIEDPVEIPPETPKGDDNADK